MMGIILIGLACFVQFIVNLYLLRRVKLLEERETYRNKVYPKY